MDSESSPAWKRSQAAQYVVSSPRCVLERIATAVVNDGHAIPRTLGEVTLQPAQREAASRLLTILRSHGGALLADPVGSGKTYVALAVAAAVGAPTIVAPASLRPMWRSACERCGIRPHAIVSMESLGRRGRHMPLPGKSTLPPSLPDDSALLIVDEAHHARNPRTGRWRALAALCSHIPCLLLSATPVHNTPRELRAILSLFLGSAVDSIASSLVTVRRPLPHDETRPSVTDHGTLRIRADAAFLNELLALPPPLAPGPNGLADAAGALATLGLLRAWTSSDAALHAALRKRLTRAVAMESILQDGLIPDRAALSRWIAGDGLVQMELPGLFAPPDGEEARLDDLRQTLDCHAAALRSLLARLQQTADADAVRAAHLARLLDQSSDARIVAFSHSAETVRALFRKLRNVEGVALLTGSGARVAGGSTSRRDVIGRFAPRAHGLRPADRAHDVRLLLTTDILSEGENLQDANVLVHLDLAWTAARMSQRLGRLVRPGSTHRTVSVFTMGAPAPPRRILAVERRLMAKASFARRALGLRERDTSRLMDEHRSSDAERVRTLLAHWLSDQAGYTSMVSPGEADPESHNDAGSPSSCGSINRDAPRPLVAYLESNGAPGWLALVLCNGSPALVAALGRQKPTDDSHTVAALLDRIHRSVAESRGRLAARLPHQSVLTAFMRLERWLRSRRAGSVLGISADAVASAVARNLLGVARAAVRRAPANERAGLERILEPFGVLAQRILPAALEAELVTMAARAKGDPSPGWLVDCHPQAVDLVRRAMARVAPHGAVQSDQVVALLTLGPGGAA